MTSCGSDADEEDVTPILKVLEDEASHDRGQRRSPRPTSFARRRVPCARRCAGQVSATSVAPVFHSPPMPRPRRKRDGGEHRDGGGESGSEGADGVGANAQHESSGAAHAVGDPTEEQAADAAGEQGERVEKSDGGFADVQVAHDVGDTMA